MKPATLIHLIAASLARIPRRTFRAVGLICAMACCTNAATADEVAEFLQRHQLRDLLATHLEQKLEAAKNDERAELVLQLASVYAESLDLTTDVSRRADLEQRSRRLLELAPQNAAEELRLALVRIAFRAAEKVAENHRLRLASESDLASARKTFSEILPELQTLRERFKQEVELHERQLSRNESTARIVESAERAQRLHFQSIFLQAWALYYNAWLNQQPQSARDAEPLFAILLETESTLPEPSEVSVDLRAEESAARSILGMALCKSMTSSPATALDWITLLMHEGAFEPLRAQAPAWRLAIMLEHQEFVAVHEMLQESLAAGEAWPMTWLRLAAAYSLERSRESRAAEELAKQVVLEIASRGELEQVLDLANRFGVDSVGKSGFALQYIHGVIKYQNARKVHGTESPTTDSNLVALYQDAATQLQAALSEPDAAAAGPSQSPQAAFALSCRRLLAWCYYFQSRFWEAHLEFVRVSESSTGKEAADSLWMSIFSLDLLAESGNASAATALDELTQRFLTEFPSNEHAPTLRLRKTLATNEVSESAVDDLLAIPSNAAAYESAQRRAADVLYQLFRQAKGEERFYFANRFLSLAIGLLSEGSRRVDLAQEGGDERYLVRCRQVLEVSLAEGLERAEIAQAGLDAIERLKEESPTINVQEIEMELTCRQAQLKLLQDDLSGAVALADQLWTKEQASVWARLATRAVFRYAYERWKSSDADAQQQTWIEYVVRYGGRVLYEFRDGGASQQNAAVGYQAAVAEASMAIWERTREPERAKAALFLFEKLLAQRPRHAAFLRAVAILSEATGDASTSLERWKDIVAGTDPALEAWFEAKFHVIRLLIAVDPARAREVMDQHKILNPGFGPPPWGERLQELDAQIPDSLEEAAE